MGLDSEVPATSLKPSVQSGLAATGFKMHFHSAVFRRRLILLGRKTNKKGCLAHDCLQMISRMSGENQGRMPASPSRSLSSGVLKSLGPQVTHQGPSFCGVSQGTCLLLRKRLAQLCIVRCNPFRSLRLHLPFCFSFPSDMQIPNAASILSTQPSPQQRM